MDRQSAGIPESVVAKAIDFFVKNGAQPDSECQQWLDSDPQHLLAWQRISQVDQQFSELQQQNIPSQVLQNSSASRRRVIKAIAGLGIVSGTGISAWHWQQNSRGFSTQLAQTQHFDFPSVKVQANAKTHFTFSDQAANHGQLLRGDIWVESIGQTHWLLAGTELILSPGTRAWLNMWQVPGFYLQSGSIINHQQARSNQTYQLINNQAWQKSKPNFQPLAWQHNQLVADAMPLSDALAYLSRYHNTYFSLSDKVKSLTVSGVFKLNRLQTALSVLEKSHQLSIRKIAGIWYRIDKV